MRIVWKDSNAKGYKPVKYRDHVIYGSPQGWITTVPGDNNIYKTHYDALNAIDQALGSFGQKGSAKRKNYGITIVGKKDGETA